MDIYRAYREAEIAKFISSKLVKTPQGHTQGRALYEAYLTLDFSTDDWQLAAMTETEFGRIMGQFIPKKRTTNGSVYLGVAIRLQLD